MDESVELISVGDFNFEVNAIYARKKLIDLGINSIVQERNNNNKIFFELEVKKVFEKKL